MTPHVHISPVTMLATGAVMFAIFSTLHLLALTAPDNRAARAFIACGF